MHKHRDARNEEHRDLGKAISASGTTLQRKVTRRYSERRRQKGKERS